MNSKAPLPSLDHLISVLTRYGEAVELNSPEPVVPKAVGLVTGVPLDPELAAVYVWCNGGRLGNLGIARYARLPIDTTLAARADERINKLFCYAGIGDFLYYLATVPALAAPDGVQPVVRFDCYEDMPIWPIASSVDRAFHLYGSYCEKVHAAGGSLEDPEGLSFPFSMTQEIAADRPLVELLEAGRFDVTLRELPGSQEEDRAWVQRILAEARSGR